MCLETHQLLKRDGSVHPHGGRKRDDRCPGSHKLPIETQVSSSSQSSSASTSDQSDTASSQPSFTTSSASGSGPSTDVTRFAHPNLKGGTIKHIPKSVRGGCAAYLVDILNKIVSDPEDLRTWTSLLAMGEDILLAPKRTGKKHNLAALIRKRINGETGHTSERDGKTKNLKSRSPEESLSAIVTSKIEDGNLRAAVRILCSEESIAPDNEETFKELCLKHPPGVQLNSSISSQESIGHLEVTEAEVLKAIRSFPSGSSGGPDGIRPQHVLQLVTCPVQGREALTAITSFTNLLLKGNCHQAIRPILFGANLLALKKKSGGIRPIAVGYTWRRLAAKCANAFALTKLSNSLQPLQLGVGVQGGCEAAVHATRRFIDNMPDDWVVAKLDFSNAFNSISRGAMLAAVHSSIPELDAFCRLSYVEPSILRYGDREIISSEGVQQGDPLGPLLFSLTIHPLLSSLTSELGFGYLDDVTVGGVGATVEDDVSMLKVEGEAIGLSLNIGKCELISARPTHTFPIISSFRHCFPNEANLLGAPLQPGPSMDSALNTQCNNLDRAVSRLKLITAHDALIILRNCLSAPKLNYTLRVSPCFGHSSLAKFDDILRRAICSIVNVNISDAQWLQASLPVRFGGLGVRSVISLAPSAYLASAAGTSELQASILSDVVPGIDPHVTSAQALWSSLSKLHIPSGLVARIQKCWDDRITESVHCSLLESTSNGQDKARLLAVSAPHSGDWLKALPLSSCGLRLDDEAIRVAVGLRLGTSLCEAHTCICGTAVNVLGTHGLACKRSSGRIGRHNYLNDIIWRALNRANVPAVKEPQGLVRSDGKRPDGVTQIPWSEGKCVTWDVTVTDTLAASNLNASISGAGSAAEVAATKKLQKYHELVTRYTFIPIAFETLGPINASAADFIDEIGKRSHAISGDSREKSFLWQRLSMALQRFNAVCFRGTFGETAFQSFGDF